MKQDAVMQSGPIKIWLQAIRPKTLSASLAPILCAVGLDYRFPSFSWWVVANIVIAALAIQIATNLINDLCDFLRGADSPERIGPQRVTQAGLVSPSGMRRVIGIVVVFALVAGIPLVARGGLPILGIGIFSLIFAFGYTAGPFPLAYLGLGEVFVLLFFGPVATLGSSYLLRLEGMSFNYLGSLLLGISCGCLSAALLVVNNIRDRQSDTKASKVTLAVRFGDRFGRVEYAFLVSAALLLPCLGSILGELPPFSAVISVLLLILAFGSIREVLGGAFGAELNIVLGVTGRLILMFGFGQLIVGLLSQ